MAKNKYAPATETPANGTDVAPVTETPIATTVTYGGFTHDVAAFSVRSAVYLMQYGWAKSLQDSVAGRKKELSEEVKLAEDGKTPLLGEDGKPILAHTPDEVAAILKTEMGERAAAIIAGTVGTHGPGKPKATSREGMILKVTREWLSAAASKAGKKLPKIGEGYEALVEKFGLAKKAEIEAEADRRMAVAAAPEGEAFEF